MEIKNTIYFELGLLQLLYGMFHNSHILVLS